MSDFKRGYHKRIPGSCSFNGMYIEMVGKAPKKGAVFVEIGCWKGRSAAFMGVEILNSGKRIKFFTVDHFEGSVNHGGDPDVVAGTLEQTARANLAPFAGIVNVIAKRSTEAAADFTDGSIDFLFIDGQHDYENVKADLLAWLPKVKRPGGIIGGDDANWPGVKEAAREVLGQIEIVEPHRKGRYWRAAPLS
jgi:SAM-dependent methyltransferase